jgi:hypothetical protein
MLTRSFGSHFTGMRLMREQPNRKAPLPEDGTYEEDAECSVYHLRMIRADLRLRTRP